MQALGDLIPVQVLGAGIQNGEQQTRSFPMSFGGQFKSGGYELIVASNLLENASRIREESEFIMEQQVKQAEEEPQPGRGDQIGGSPAASHVPPVDRSRRAWRTLRSRFV